MGWLGFGKKEDEPHVIHTGERKQCWAARDAFFACLDEAQITDAIKEDKRARLSCSKEVKAFEQACITSWVEYFKQKRVQDIARKARIDALEAKGYKPLDISQSNVKVLDESPK